MLWCVSPVTTNGSEERAASILKEERIWELGTKLSVTNKLNYTAKKH
jgi:hypothetical protein